MSLFRSIGNNLKGRLNSEKVMDDAIQLIRQGQIVDAVSMMKHCVLDVQNRWGAKSMEHAESLFHFGTVFCAAKDYKQGADACREAADACPDTHDGKKARLTYLMNVGQMLVHAGAILEAIPILEKSLTERYAFYGDGHAGVAYGEQVLAQALLAGEAYAEGLRHAKIASKIFEEARHHEFPETFALAAALGSAVGESPENIWRGLADYPEEVVQPIIDKAHRTAPLMAGSLGCAYLEQLVRWCDKYLPNDTIIRLNTAVTWSNLASERHDLQSLAQATDAIEGMIELLNSIPSRVQMIEGLALNRSQCGRPPEEVRELYARAGRLAREHDLLLVAARVARNYAIYEAECQRPSQALEKYDEAIQLAEASGASGQEILGRTLIAKGIFLQHQGRPQEAAPLLAKGIAALPATHSDAACGVIHQVALQHDLACGCDGEESMQEETAAVLIRKFMEQSGLGDLVHEVGFSEDGLKIGLARTPTDEELERLQIAHRVFSTQLSWNTK
jgi:tetratricopeptide (TPR) repeat protein